MSQNTYFLDGYTGDNPSKRYVYALRKDDDGTLYVARVDIMDMNDDITLFYNPPAEELENFSIPGSDFFENRDPDTKELKFDRGDVKYEQWMYTDNLMQHYINADGEFVVAFGLDTPPYNLDSMVSNTAGGMITPFTHTVYGNASALDVRKLAIANGWNGLSEVVIINEGIVGSDNTNRPAIMVAGNFPNGVIIINNNTIVGASGFTTVSGDLVEPGDAIQVMADCDIINSGNIQGGNAPWSGGTDGYAIRGVSFVTLTNSGTVGSTI